MNSEKKTSPFDLSELSGSDELDSIKNNLDSLPHAKNVPSTYDEVARGDRIARNMGMLKDGITTLPSKRHSSNIPRKHLHVMLELKYAEWFINWTKDNRYTYEQGIIFLMDFYNKRSSETETK